MHVSSDSAATPHRSSVFAISVFTILAIGLHWCKWLLPIAFRSSIVDFGMATPALAAALVYVAFEKRSLFSQEVRRRIWGARPLVIVGGIALVLALQAIAFAVTVFSVQGSFSLTIFQRHLAHSHLNGLSLPAAAAITVAVNLLIGTLLGVLPALGEEIGWRGFLYPRLESLSGYAGAVVIGGVIWSFWHSPDFYFSNNFNGYALPWWLGCAYFCLFTVPGGIAFYWLYRASGSILAPAFAHAAVDQSFGLMGLFLNDSKLSARITTPGGAITMIVWWLAAIALLWFDHHHRNRRTAKQNSGA
jgi:membrane protease YdiL (CAAX protease family)